jgi:hypothetical protein
MKRDSGINQLQSLYEQDEHLWLTETITLLKENRLAELDIKHFNCPYSLEKLLNKHWLPEQN